jgi:citrate lyase alpha subunit
LKDEAEKICGVPEKLNLGEEIVAIIKWVDDTVIDAIRRVIPG